MMKPGWQPDYDPAHEVRRAKARITRMGTKDEKGLIEETKPRPQSLGAKVNAILREAVAEVWPRDKARIFRRAWPVKRKPMAL